MSDLLLEWMSFRGHVQRNAEFYNEFNALTASFACRGK
jgi:hypothetical protein